MRVDFGTCIIMWAAHRSMNSILLDLLLGHLEDLLLKKLQDAMQKVKTKGFAVRYGFVSEESALLLTMQHALSFARMLWGKMEGRRDAVLSLGIARVAEEEEKGRNVLRVVANVLAIVVVVVLESGRPAKKKLRKKRKLVMQLDADFVISG